MLLIKFSADYADEFNIYGFSIVSEEVWNDYVRHLHNYLNDQEEYEWFFGTNEFIYFDSSSVRTLAENILNHYQVTKLDALQTGVLTDLFREQWGNFPWIGW